MILNRREAKRNKKAKISKDNNYGRRIKQKT
jgi:hypothetical protein